MASPVPLPIGFTSWAFNKNPDGTPVDKDAVFNMVKAARACGCKSIAVQQGQGVTGADVTQLGLAGLSVAGWGLADATTASWAASSGVSAYVGQVEGYGQRDAFLAALPNIKVPTMLVTDWGGFDDHTLHDQLAALGCTTVLVESYAVAGASHADLNNYVVAPAKARGYQPGEMFPLCGTYRQELPSAYAGLAQFGRQFGVYLLEPMQAYPSQEAAWAAVPDAPAPAPKTYWDAYVGTKLLFSAEAVTYPDGTTGLSRALDYLDGQIGYVRTIGAGSVQKATR